MASNAALCRTLLRLFTWEGFGTKLTYIAFSDTQNVQQWHLPFW